MAIKSTLSARRINSVWTSLVLIAGLAACQTTGTKSTTGNTPSTPPIVQVPTQLPPSPTTPAAPLPPMPEKNEAKKVAVILGPGGAKAMAHIGVLKALQQQRIPIEKIVGLEWGALVGGLYSSKGQINDVEWKLYKMEQKGLPRAKGFFSKRWGDDSVKIMDDFLGDAFGREEVRSGKIQFSCPVRSIWTGVVAWQTKGLMKDTVKRCLPYPPVFKAQGTFIGGASQAVEAVDWLRKDGYNVIIVVNVLGSALPVAQENIQEQIDNVILWQEVKRALVETSRYNVEYVNVDTSAYPIVQFESKKELVSLGEAAGQRAAAELISKYGF